MSKSYKRWSKQEKIKILQAAEQEGVISACRKHEVSTATFYGWKKIYEQLRSGDVVVVWKLDRLGRSL